MEENNTIKIAHVLNLPMLNVRSQLNINIDSNANIKQILNIEANLIESQIETMFNKAVVKGVVGVKILYIDTDNMYNTLSDSVSFNESINSEIITSECQIDISSSLFAVEFTNDEKSLHLTLDGNIECFCNLNSNLNCFNPYDENLVVKKSVLQAYSCIQKFDKSASYNYAFNLDSSINKILSCDSKVTVDEVKCYEGYVLVTGQIFNNVVYEVSNDAINTIKVINNSTPFKCEFEASLCDNECVADVHTTIDLNNTQITTDIGENSTKFDVEYCINTCGYVYKALNINIVEDLYSVNNEIEIVNNNYNLCKKMPYLKSVENVDAEITLADELNVDQMLGIINMSANITQSSVKDNGIDVEGVINGNLLYLDENGEIKNLPTQLPYTINMKQEINDSVCAMRLNVVPIACKCKIKRGNILMLDYEVCVTANVYSQSQVTLIDNIKYGKAITYGDIAFQIYVAHPNESCWNLCKRLHVSQDKLALYNKENPATYNGGEKIIVYR